MRPAIALPAVLLVRAALPLATELLTACAAAPAPSALSPGPPPPPAIALRCDDPPAEGADEGPPLPGPGAIVRCAREAHLDAAALARTTRAPRRGGRAARSRAARGPRRVRGRRPVRGTSARLSFMRANVLTPDRSGAPVLILEGAEDGLITPARARCVVDHLREHGVDPRVCVVRDADHLTCRDRRRSRSRSPSRS